MSKDQKYLDNLRHSTAHLLASAVMELYPKVKRTIGPAIENGFYFDFDFGDTKITDSDLSKIEKKMREILPSWHKFEEVKLSKNNAIGEYPDNPYKQELIEEFANENEELSFYGSFDSTGKKLYWDLCKGGHVEHPSTELKHFKLLSIAGAYWRGDEKNKMLTRIYGTVFPTEKELDEHLNMLEEAKKRDHKKLGRELELFMFHETSPGCPYWLPKGLRLYNELIKFWREEHDREGYQETSSPLINKSDLFETSGHWEHYKEDMFIADMGENEKYGLKPMNCPNAMLIFDSKTRSYKNFPLRISDTDRLHRYELSGTLNGLFRARSFQQDDSHNFISEDMIESEYEHVFSMCEKFYGVFGLEFSYRLGTRPEGYLGEIETWNKAEKILKKVLDNSKRDYFVLEGDGAFYGPKVDILMKDAIGREWQMGTIQLDFQQPKRFNLKYSDKDGTEKTPVVVHRVIYGSFERFIGILIEHFAGNFPVWISPVQVTILPITDRNLDYSNKVLEELKSKGIRVDLDDTSETLGNKIRKAQGEKVPYMLIIGDKEESVNKVAVRQRDGKDLGQISLKDFVQKLQDNVSSKSLEL